MYNMAANNKFYKNLHINNQIKQFFLITLFLLIGINQTVLGQGIEIYQVKNVYPNFSEEAQCHYCSMPKIEDLYKNPLISEKDIIKFNLDNQKIELTKDAQERINKLQIPLQGLPVALTINREIIYGFWLWNEVSSFGCDRIYTYTKLNFEIEFGLPSNNKFGDDPRFDKRLKAYLEK